MQLLYDGVSVALGNETEILRDEDVV